MMGRRLIKKIGATAIAVTLAFGVLSQTVPGDVALAEENVTEEVTDAIQEDAEVAKETDKNVADDEDKFVTVSGNIIGYTFDEPLQILFDVRGYHDEDVHSVTTEAKDGRYSVELFKDEYYIIRLPGADGFCMYDPDNEGIYVNTFSGDLEFDIRILMLDFDISGEISKDEVFDVADDTDFDEFYEACSGCVISFEGNDYYEERVLSDDVYSGPVLPIGEYIVTFKGKTGNVYSVEPLSLHWRNNGYLDYLDIIEPYYYSTSPCYGDYRTRDNEARIVCHFGDIQDLDLSNATFYFVDSNNNRTNDCSYIELKYGLIRLPKDKSYKLVASGLPDGYVLDYSNMSDIIPAQEHCGDAWYDYDVKVTKGSVQVPLAITKDTEDIVATKAGKKYTFIIEAEGTDLSYSWYVKKPGATKFSKAGVYKDEYSLYAKENNDGMQVYCVVTDGNGKKLVGRTATFKIEYPAPVITYPNGKEISAPAGKKANFSISVKSDLELTYSWYYMLPKTNGGDGKFHKAGCYEATYTRSAGKKIDGMQAYCLVTDSNGKKIKSDVITFTLK